MVESDTCCIDVLTQVSAATKALQSAAALESGSQHTITRSIVEAAGGHLAAVHFQTADGLGASAIVDGHQVFVGRPQFVVQHAQCAGIQMPSHSAGTVVAVGWGGAVRGFITLADTIKEGSATAIAQLKAQGLRPVLLTGDSAAVAGSVAHEAGITDVITKVLPAQKVRVVEDSKARGHRVATDSTMPLRRLSLIGIAMSSGAAAAISASDITLIRSDLADVSDAIALSRRTLRTIEPTSSPAFAYNVAAIPLAVSGVLNSMYASAAVTFSSLIVVGNSLRLCRFGR